jgi:hypothetical protein
VDNRGWEGFEQWNHVAQNLQDMEMASPETRIVFSEAIFLDTVIVPSKFFGQFCKRAAGKEKSQILGTSP